MLSQLFLVLTPWFCSAVDKSHFLSQICTWRNGAPPVAVLPEH